MAPAGSKVKYFIRQSIYAEVTQLISSSFYAEVAELILTTSISYDKTEARGLPLKSLTFIVCYIKITFLIDHCNWMSLIWRNSIEKPVLPFIAAKMWNIENNVVDFYYQK